MKKDSLGRAIGARANNGAENRGLTEGQVLVKGPAELIDGMAELARSRGEKVRKVWRDAAEAYLARFRGR